MRKSIDNLVCATLDLALLHDPEHVPPARLAAELDALAAARSAGQMRALVIGTENMEVMLDVVEHDDIDCIVLSAPCTLLGNSAADELRPYASLEASA